MSILFRYVLREFASTWLVVMMALSLMLCGSLFVRALERVAELASDWFAHHTSAKAKL